MGGEQTCVLIPKEVSAPFARLDHDPDPGGISNKPIRYKGKDECQGLCWRGTETSAKH